MTLTIIIHFPLIPKKSYFKGVFLIIAALLSQNSFFGYQWNRCFRLYKTQRSSLLPISPRDTTTHTCEILFFCFFPLFYQLQISYVHMYQRGTAPVLKIKSSQKPQQT